MLVREFVLTLVCSLFHQEILCQNAKTHIRYKKSEDESSQPNLKGSVHSIGDEQISSNFINKSSRNDKPDILNLHLDDVVRPVAQNVPNLFKVNDLLSSSIPLPVQLLLIEDEQQNEPNSELSVGPNEKPPHVGKKVISNESPVSKKPALKQKSTMNKDRKNIKNGGNKSPLTSESYKSKTDVNQKRHHDPFLENSMKNRTNNRDFDKEINNSTEVSYNDEVLDKAVEYLLKILRNAHNLKELLALSSKNVITQEKNNADTDYKEVINSNNGIVQKSYETINENNVQNGRPKNMNFTSSEIVSQLLQEQNNLLKDILFKVLDRNNQTNSNESTTKKIHLTLDINHLESKRDDIPVNLDTGRNDSETILVKVNYQNKNNAVENINSGERFTTKVRNNVLNNGFHQIPQHHILNSYTSNYPYPYFISPVNKSTYYDYRRANYHRPIASNVDSINKVDVIPEEREDMLIYEPMYLNNQTNDAIFNNPLKYNEYVKTPLNSQSGGTFYYNRKPTLAVGKCPFHGVYYNRH